MKVDRRQFLWLATSAAFAAATNPRLLTDPWKAQWIRLPGTPPNDYGVYHFRRTFDVAEQPASFLVHVTADNRYRLFVNGTSVSWGPARGDLNHWRYESVDLAPFLRRGRNAIAAVVWNDGRNAAVAQISSQTGFLLQGDTPAEEVINTGVDWYAIQDRAYRPLAIAADQITGYYVAPPGEIVEGAVYPWNWTRNDFEDGNWRAIEAIPNGRGAPRDSRDAPNRWMLVPRTIPPMEETPQRFARVRLVEGASPSEKFPLEPVAFQIPASKRVRLLLDHGHLTTAFPELMVSGGRDSRITLRYAESLYVPAKTPHDKANRNDVEGKVMLGPVDIFSTDGGARRLYRPLHWRTFRYVEVTIDTGNDGLVFDDLRSVYTGYPFQRKAHFEGGDAILQQVLDTGWRTARLCAHETYMDCPYYEQLQYAGDARIQCLVSLYNSGDARLMRNAIAEIDASRTAEGATFSRAPSALQQYIPGFSLWWIGMVHDYWMYVDDPAFVKQMLPGVRAVLDFFAAHQKANGSLGRMPWWNYVDWVEKWPSGVPPRGTDDSSAPQDLQLAMAYAWAARMESTLGRKAMAEDYAASADKLRAIARTLYWDPRRGLYADTSKHDIFSQHTNALAVLAEVANPAESRAVMEKTLSATDLAPASVYFRYYLHAAMTQAGLGDRYLEMLAPWKEMLALGVTTWPEIFQSTSRSDCHAWGASPNIELFRTVLGVDAMAPGFRRVLIRPHLGDLPRASGVITHPKGEIAVRLEMRAGKPAGEITLPSGVDGEFRWRGVTRSLGAGKTVI